MSTEDQVIFYNTYGYSKDGAWIIPMRIWVHEKPGFVRRSFAKGAREVIANRARIEKLNESQKELFMARAEDFITDSESNEAVAFTFDNDPDNKEYRIKNEDGKSKADRNGLLEGTLTLSQETANKLLDAQNSRQGWLTYRAVSGDHSGNGSVRLLQTTGLSVISDIDDTIKITEIPAGEGVVLKNTFFHDFIAAPCMTQMYQAFGSDVAFHYVGGGPWQLYGPLVDFLFRESVGFPQGSFHMMNARTNPFESETFEDLWTLIASGSLEATFNFKIAQISTLMTNFPERKFILIGDSGQRDPEVFRKIQVDFPEQVREIRIRDVVNDKEKNPRRLDKITVIPPNVEQGVSCSEFTKTE